MELVSLYQYDPTARASANRIVNESVTVIPPTEVTDYSYVIPRAAPFYVESLIIKDGKTTGARTLVENVDYWCVIDFLSASVGLGKRISVGIALLDPNYSGTLYVTYQTLGGNYTLADYSVLEELIRERYVIKHVSYEQIINLPAGFSPEWHNHEIGDMVGMSSVVQSLNAIKTATEGRNGSYDQLQQNLNNHVNSPAAHKPADVGLGNVKNYGVGTLTDAKNGTTTKYVTADILKEYVTFARQDVTGILTISEGDIRYLAAGSLSGYHTKSASDSRYALKSDTYTKTQVDSMVSSAGGTGSLDSVYTKIQSDAKYALIDSLNNYIQTSVADNKYATKTGMSSYYTKTESEGRYPLKTGVYTKTESDAKYATSSDLTVYMTTTAADGKYQTKLAMSNYYQKDALDDAKLTSSSFSTSSTAADYMMRLTQKMPNGGSTYLDVPLTLDLHPKKTEVYTKSELQGMLPSADKVSFTNLAPWGAYQLTLNWEIVKVGSVFYISVQNNIAFYASESNITLHTAATTTLPATNIALRPSAMSLDLGSSDSAFNWYFRNRSSVVSISSTTGDITFSGSFNYDQNNRVSYVAKGFMYVSIMLVATDKSTYDALNKLMSRGTVKSYTP